MRTLDLARIAAEAEAFRYRRMIGRQGFRAAMGAIAGVFAISVLVLLNVAGWQLLVLAGFEPLYATLMLLGVNLVLAVIFGGLAARSSESQKEHEARHIRQKALDEMRSSMVISAALPVIGMLWRLRTRPAPKRLR